MSNSALQRQRTALDSQCFWLSSHSSQFHLHLPPPSLSHASVKPPLFQRVPQQRAIIDGVCYISPNDQPKRGPVCLLQKYKPACFCPKTCNLNSQTGQGRGSRKPKLQKAQAEESQCWQQAQLQAHIFLGPVWLVVEVK